MRHSDRPLSVHFSSLELSTILILLSLLVSQGLPRDPSQTRQRQHHVRQTGHGRGRTQASNQEIPHLLHHIYLTGFEAFQKDAAKPDAKLPIKFFNSCQEQHQQWDSLFWDEEMGRMFVKQHYPWFLDIWENFDGWGKQDKKSDALRFFIMHHYGGLYLDLDVECFKPADESLRGYQVVLQGAGDGGINNAVMASIPGHPFWLAYAQEVEARSSQGDSDSTNAPMYMSGTMALTKSLLGYVQSPKVPVNGYTSYEYPMNGTMRMYALGEWYFPCYGDDHICIDQFEKETAEGIWDMSDVYGRHYFREQAPGYIEKQLEDHYVT